MRESGEEGVDGRCFDFVPLFKFARTVGRIIGAKLRFNLLFEKRNIKKKINNGFD